MKKTQKSTNNNIKKNTKKLSRKKINKIIKVNFKLTTVYKTFYDFNVKDCYRISGPILQKWKLVDILPNEIINYIKSIKYKIKDYLFYDTYVCCGSPLDKYKSFYNPYRVTFFSKKKILSVYYVMPKNTSYENIKKIFINNLKDKIWKSELGIYGTNLYKLNNKIYHMDWDLHNFELINNNSTK